MNRLTKLAVLALTMSVSAVMAQEQEPKQEGYTFTMVKEVKTTDVENQHRSSTCWSFSGIAFLETELLRMGKPAVDLSEMFIVRNVYAGKAEKYVRLQGSMNFAGGGSFYDVIETIRKYGIVPEEAYPAYSYGEEAHVHGELDAVTKVLC